MAYLTIWSYCWAISSQWIGRVSTGCQAAAPALRAGVGPVEPRCADVLQPRQQREAEQVGEGEPDLGRAVGVDVVGLDRHVGAVPQHALDHRRDLGGRAGLELGVDAQPARLDVPVDHHAGAAVAGVPLGHQVRLPGAELLGVRGARGAARPTAPGRGRRRWR